MEDQVRPSVKRKRDSDRNLSCVCIVHINGVKLGELHPLSELQDADKNHTLTLT